MNLAQGKCSQDVALLAWKSRVREETWKNGVASRLTSFLPYYGGWGMVVKVEVGVVGEDVGEGGFRN